MVKQSDSILRPDQAIIWFRIRFAGLSSRLAATLAN